MYNNPCDLTLNPKNTGVECDSAMLATAMLIFMPQSARWTDADVAAAPYNGNFTAFVEDKIHAAPSARWFPIFGNAAPINVITDANEADVTETLDDGSTVFIRYGKANRTFSTTKGGACLAQKLMQFPQGYAFIEVDLDGKVAAYEPTSGTYGGFPTIMVKGLAPDSATLKTSFKNKMMITYDKVAYYVSGKITSPDTSENILAVNGLLDAEVTAGTKNTQSTTNIYVGVKTECANTDLVALYNGTGAGKIGQVTNFVVTKKTDGSSVTPSAVAIVNGEVQLTGTFTTATDYVVALAPAATLKANGIEGYEGIISATVSIP